MTDDDRMDERLRDYASRWTAARPAPGGVTVRDGRRGRSWVPLAAAASVVALLARVAFVGSRGRELPGPPAASATTSPRAAYQPCRQGQVVGDVSPGLVRAQSASSVITLFARGESCTIPRAPEVEVLGDGGEGVGVEYAFEGPDTEVLLSDKVELALRLSLVWEGPFCPWDTKTLVTRVTLREGVTFEEPMERSEAPPCGDGITRGSAMRGRWEPPPCDEAAYDVLSTSVTNVRGGPAGAGVVRLEVVLRNVSQFPCEVNVKPELGIRTQDGYGLVLSSVAASDARHEPALAPGERVRATVDWYSYCGATKPGAYTLTLRVGPAGVPFTVDRHPVPPCVSSATDPETDGRTVTSWLQPLDRGTPASPRG